MPAPRRQLVLCLRNDGYEVSLERRKIYAALPDRDASEHGQVRVIDESGEDDVYPARFCAAAELPQAGRRAVLSVLIFCIDFNLIRHPYVHKCLSSMR